MRGIAACIVAFGYHAKLLLEPEALGSGDGGAAVHWLHSFGWTAVDLFFVLSGYVFAHVYLRSASLNRPTGLREFWIARFARLYPLHLVMLIVTGCLFRNHETPMTSGFITNLLMLQAFRAPVAQFFNGPSWSISVEFVCYAIFALAAWKSRRSVHVVSLVMIGIGAIGVAIAGDLSVHSIIGNVSRGLLGFFVGQLLWRARDDLATISTPVLAAGMLAGLAIATFIGADSPGMILPLTCLAWPCAIMLAKRERLFAHRALLWLGNRSYAIYMINLPLLMVMANTGGLATSWPGALLRQVVLIAANLLIADLVYRRFELPAQTFCRTILRRQLPAPASSQSSGALT